MTTVAVSDELNVDLGPHDKVYGIELLNANQQLGPSRAKTLVVQNRRSGKKLSSPWRARPLSGSGGSS